VKAKGFRVIVSYSFKKKIHSLSSSSLALFLSLINFENLKFRAFYSVIGCCTINKNFTLRISHLHHHVMKPILNTERINILERRVPSHRDDMLVLTNFILKSPK